MSQQNIEYYLKKQPNYIFGCPAILEFILKLDNKELDLSSVTDFITGGDFLPDSKYDEAIQFFNNHNSNINLCNGSGNAETAGANTITFGSKIKKGTVGKVLVGSDVIVVNPDTLEEVKYNEEKQRIYRRQRTENLPCFEYEIIYDKKHIGWISAYYMTDDFKYNGIKKTNNIAIGIDIPYENMRGKGIGVKALKEYHVDRLIVAGGVAANQGLRENLQKLCHENNIHLIIPPMKYCTDNAAMIGAAAYFAYKKGRIATLDLNAKATEELK